MIEVELHHRETLTAEPRAVAAVRLNDDLTYTVVGDEQLLQLDSLRVMDPKRGAGVFFIDDPEWWLLHLENAFRTPYLVPVVTVAEPSGQSGVPVRID